MRGRPPLRRARALLLEGRVSVLDVGPDRVLAEVDCSEAGRLLVRYLDGRWSCPCLRGGVCPHVVAVASVTDLPAPQTVSAVAA